MKSVDDRLIEGFSSYTHGLLQATLRNPTNNARLAFAVKLVLVILIALSAAKMTWAIYSLSLEQSRAAAPPPQTAATTRQQPQGTLGKVAELHLFGVVAVKQAPIAAPIKAPETRLKLVLNGVFSSDDPATSMAIIAETGKKDATFFRGDTVPGNAKLHEIYSDRVILSRGGKLETLSLKRPEAKIGGLKEGATTAQDADAAPQPAAAQEAQDTTQELQQIRNRLAAQPKDILKDLRFTPVETQTKGELKGYRLEYADGRLLKQLGLEPEDIITEVNGIPVTSTKNLMEMMKDAASIKELNLSILRNGTPQSLTVRLN